MRNAWLRRPLGAAAIGLLAAGALAAGAASAQGARHSVGSGNVPLFEGASADWQWSVTTRVTHNRRSVRICSFPSTRLNHPRTPTLRSWSLSTYCRVFPMRRGRVILNGYSESSRRTRDNFFRQQGGLYNVDGGPSYTYSLLAMVTRANISAPRVAFTDGVVPLTRARTIRVGRDRLRLWLGFRASGGGDHCAFKATGIKRVGSSSRRVVLDAYRGCGAVNP